VRFEYDPAKSASNKAKHGIDFEEAKKLWAGRHTRSPIQKITGETRLLVIGKIGDLFWSAVVTMRGEIVRIISVRRSRDDEKEIYQKNIG
jgi:hypothetical protein